MNLITWQFFTWRAAVLGPNKHLMYRAAEVIPGGVSGVNDIENAKGK